MDTTIDRDMQRNVRAHAACKRERQAARGAERQELSGMTIEHYTVNRC